MNLVDSSGWIEYFADEENADFFAEPIQQTNQLIVSAINIYEVFKHVLREEDHSKANQECDTLKKHSKSIPHESHLRPRVDLDQKNPDSFYWTGKL